MQPKVQLAQRVDDAKTGGGSNFGREEAVPLLAQRIAQYPTASKKVLAMYYHENMRFPDIAKCLGATESEIHRIHAQTVASIQLLLANN